MLDRLTLALTEQEVLDMLAACGPGAPVEELARRLAYRAQERLPIVYTIPYLSYTLVCCHRVPSYTIFTYHRAPRTGALTPSLLSPDLAILAAAPSHDSARNLHNP